MVSRETNSIAYNSAVSMHDAGHVPSARARARHLHPDLHVWVVPFVDEELTVRHSAVAAQCLQHVLDLRQVRVAPELVAWLQTE